MTIRLDLRKRLDPAQPGQAMLRKTILAPRPYGCADCGRWYAFARQAVQCICHERQADA